MKRVIAGALVIAGSTAAAQQKVFPTPEQQIATALEILANGLPPAPEVVIAKDANTNVIRLDIRRPA